MTDLLKSTSSPRSDFPPETSQVARYRGGAISLHWLMAALVAFVGGLGLLFDDIPRESRLFWINIHAFVGICILILVVARMIYRTTHRPPDLPGEIGEFTRRTSHAAHMLLYALMFVVPILGAVAFFWHFQTLDIGIFKVTAPVAKVKSIYDPAEAIHVYLAYGLLGLAGIHILAALYHQFVLRDRVLMRILPGGPG